ncbi:MAG: type II secretion system F family protein [bacterium]
MSVYSYKAKNKRGQLIEGIVDASSEDAVSNMLHEKELAIINIGKREQANAEEYKFNFLRRVKNKELVVFFRQMAVMINANLPIVKILRILVRQTSDKNLKSIIAHVADEVDGGAKLSEAMGEFHDTFSDFYVNMIRSGETSGRLSEVMDYLASQQESDYELQSKVRGAMIYPIFILAGLALVGGIVMVFVIPQITSVLKESGVVLPWSTQALIWTAEFLKNFWWAIILSLALLSVIINFYVHTPSGRYAFDVFKLKIPIFGKIFKNIYIVRLMRSFSTLLKGGVPVSRALEVVRDVVGSRVYEDILTRTIANVDEGNPIAESLSDSKHIPVLVSQMISVGEESGKLEEVVEKITDFYDREIDNSVRNLSVLIEPIVMIFLGLAVGFFVAAVILPMWQLSAAM